MAKQRKAKTDSSRTEAGGLGVMRMAMQWGIAGASLAIVGGFGYWAVSLGSRNPNEVPIIRAMEGPARVQPDNPGGEQASHQGLAVNSVQSNGSVAAPANKVVLAPPPEPLSSEDLANADLEPVQAPDRKTMSPADKQPVQQKLALQVEQPAKAPAPKPVRLSEQAIHDTPYSPRRSLRPFSRPQRLVAQLQDVQPASARPDSPVDSVDSVPLGTRLVQLGAYDSPDLAAREWGKLFAKHGDLLDGKKRLIQAAESGGRKFFRLRAVGFASKDESRALCSALLARGTPCIPVTAR